MGTILVDACPRGEAPGTVFVLEPDLAHLDLSETGPAVLDAHGHESTPRAASGPVTGAAL